MNVRVATDISFCDSTKIGVYAIEISYGTTVEKRVGKFKTNPRGSIDCEIKCVGNALKIVLRKISIVKSLALYCDSISAIRVLTGQLPAKKKEDYPTLHICLDLIKAIETRHGIKIQINHVKGHTSSLSQISRSNDWCDRAAREHLRKLRKGV